MRSIILLANITNVNVWYWVVKGFIYMQILFSLFLLLIMFI